MGELGLAWAEGGVIYIFFHLLFQASGAPWPMVQSASMQEEYGCVKKTTLRNAPQTKKTNMCYLLYL